MQIERRFRSPRFLPEYHWPLTGSAGKSKRPKSLAAATHPN
jgi:hypothetical protein